MSIGDFTTGHDQLFRLSWKLEPSVAGISPMSHYLKSLAQTIKITTEEFTADEITEIVRTFSTRHDWSLLYRNPLRFFKVYSYLFKKPRILWEIGYRTVRRFINSLVAAKSEAS